MLLESFAVSILGNLIALLIDVLRQYEHKGLEKDQEEKLNRLRKQIEEIKNTRSLEEDVSLLFNAGLRNAQYDIDPSAIALLSQDPELAGIMGKWIFTVVEKEADELIRSACERISLLLFQKVPKEKADQITQTIFDHLKKVILSDQMVSNLRSELAHSEILNRIESVDKKIDALPQRIEKIISDKVFPTQKFKSFTHNIPFPPNPHFKGRGLELKKLFDLLVKKEKDIAITPLGVSGMGGLGKTQLAVEFGHQYLNPHFPGGVFWVVATTRETIQNDMENLAPLLGRDMLSFSSPRDRLEWVRHTLGEEGGHCLLVFDNVTTESCYREFLPYRKTCRILLTSRLSNLPHIEEMPLDKLDSDAGYDLLTCKRKPSNPGEEETAKQIAQLLGYFPLALELAAHYLSARPHGSFGQYLDKIRKHGGLASLEETKKELEKTFSRSFTDHDVSVFATFNQNMELIDGNESALKILRIASLFDNNHTIPAEILMNAFYEMCEGNDEKKKEEYDTAIGILMDASLVKHIDHKMEEKDVIKSRLWLHPLLSEFLIMISPSDEISSSITSFVNAAKKHLTLDESEIAMRFREIVFEIPHLRKALGFAEKIKDKHGSLSGHYFYNLGNFYYTKQELDEALSLLQKSEDITGKKDTDLASIYNLKGLVLKDKGDLEGALQYLNRALEIDEKIFGKDHPTVAISVNNIAMVLQDKGDLDGALEYMNRALEIDEKTFGKDHPNVAIRVNNIATVLKDRGNLDGALQYLNRALGIDEKIFGKDHPNVARDVNNIAMALKDKGDLDGALEYLFGALGIFEKIYGENHPNVGTLANNIALVHKDKGDPDAALKYLNRALEIDEKTYGKDHPNVAIRVNNIALVLQDKGDMDAALKYLNRSLEIDEKTFGKDHPNVAIRVNNIAMVLKEKGDLDAARKHLKRACIIALKTYGIENPTTQTFIRNYISCQGDPKDLLG